MSAPFRIEEVAARIEAEVAELTGQLGEAADFADLVERKKLPAKTGGFVLPGGLRGGAADAASGSNGVSCVVGRLAARAARQALML